MHPLNTILRVGFFCSALLAMSSTQAGNSYSPKTISVGLKAVKEYIPNAIFWVSSENDTEARYRALRSDNLKYDIDEDTSHAYTVKLRLKPIDIAKHINFDTIFKNRLVSFYAKTLFQ